MVRNGRRVNAKSIMGVMMLAAGKGAKVMLETDGPDEAEAMDAWSRWSPKASAKASERAGPRSAG